TPREFVAGAASAPTSTLALRSTVEEPLASGALEDGVHRRAICRRQRRPSLPQPAETLPLVRERPLYPRASVHPTLHAIGPACERLAVRQEERHVGPPRLAEERAEAIGGLGARK